MTNDDLADAIVGARPQLAELYAEAVDRGMTPKERAGHHYFLLLDQLNPPQLLTYALGDDGQLYRAPVAERQDPHTEAREFLLHYPRSWLTIGPAGELLSNYGGTRTPIRDKVRTDLIRARVAAAQTQARDALQRNRD